MRPLAALPTTEELTKTWATEAAKGGPPTTQTARGGPPTTQTAKSGPQGNGEPSGAGGVKSRIDGWLHEGEGRRNAEAGQAHPALYTVLRKADRAFAPTKNLVPKRMRQFLAQTNRAYSAAVEQYSRMGIPLPFDPDSTGEPLTPPDILAGKTQVESHAARTGSTHLATEICVRAAPGHVPVIEQVHSSGIKEFDRLAREAMQQALPREPLPAGVPACQACYAFNADFGRILPSDYLTCLATGLLDGFKCLRNGGEWFRHGVRLVQVWAVR